MDLEKGWTENTLESRIDRETRHKQRYPAGSPDAREIQAYTLAIPTKTPRRSALVLGMTPELRSMAVHQFDHVYSVDDNPTAIALYSSWLDDHLQSKETIIEMNWFSIKDGLPQKVDVIFGDGVFGNLKDANEHRELLNSLHSVLNHNGCIITRKALIPDSYSPTKDHYLSLLLQYRKGELDAAEFGFGVRLIGHYACCYDKQRHSLDNTKLFKEMESLYHKGVISDEEKAAIWRYYFNGENCILTDCEWETLLNENGYRFTTHSLQGRHWYRYYKIYCLSQILDSRDVFGA